MREDVRLDSRAANSMLGYRLISLITLITLISLITSLSNPPPTPPLDLDILLVPSFLCLMYIRPPTFK